MYTVMDKKTGTPQKYLLLLFIRLNIVAMYEINFISIDSPIQELSTTTTGRTIGLQLQLQLQLN